MWLNVIYPKLISSLCVRLSSRAHQLAMSLIFDHMVLCTCRIVKFGRKDLLTEVFRYNQRGMINYIILTKREDKMAGFLFSLFSLLFTLSVFLLSSSIRTEKSHIIFYCHEKYFAKENFRAPAWTSAKSYCGNKTGNPERAVSLPFARWG